MQKKDYSASQDSTSKLTPKLSEDRKDLFKKATIWGGLILASVAGLALLIILAQRGGTPQTPIEKANLPPVTEADITSGKAEGNVVLIEYADFQCPACATYNPMLKTLEGEYPDNLKIVYRIFPLNTHKNAEPSARAAYAAWKMGNFVDMKDLLYENQGDWSGENDPTTIFIEYAKDIGLNSSDFEKVMKSKEAKNFVSEDKAEAVNLGLNATPSFFLGKKQIFPRNIDDFRILINAEIEKIN